MRKINGKTVLALLVSTMLLSPIFVRTNFAQPGATTIYVNPPSLTVNVGTQFTVDINVENVVNLWAFEFWLSYNTTLLDAISVVLGPFLNAPRHVIQQQINDPQGWLMLAATSDTVAPPANGGGTLGTVTFNCTGAGTTPLHLYSTSLFDPAMTPIVHLDIDGSVTQQTPKPQLPWFVKPSYPDYAPAGVPDFDQKQDNWLFPNSGWTWCGSVSVANSLWWLDSEYESLLFQNPVPPPAVSDHYKLVTAYGNWDDHDPQNVGPLVTNLALLMDTDGMRTHLNHTGTYFNDMQAGISQYIAQQGLNPYGDCDGNGVVDHNDIVMVEKALGSRPGDPNWNMACDFNHDNIINMADVATVAANYGKVGMFYEHTVVFPAFPWVEDQVYACEDVVLLLEFWQYDGVNWTRYNGLGYDLPGGMGGHYVTVAGVNSTTSELLISDPFWDAFEAGKVPGDSPFPHPYPHTSDVHNDTQFVSHDAYPALPAPLSPYPAQLVFELPTYLAAEGFDPSWHTFIRAAVVTSHQSIVPGNVESSKDRCLPMPTVGKGFLTDINATIINEGSTAQDFTVTVYANSTLLGTTTVNNLAPGANVTVTVATWNTTTYAYGDYFLTASTNASYPTFTSDFAVRVVIPGDINGDGTVDIFDAVILAGAFNSKLGSSNWNPNADINDDGSVDIFDAVILAGHFNQHYP